MATSTLSFPCHQQQTSEQKTSIWQPCGYSFNFWTIPRKHSMCRSASQTRQIAPGWKFLLGQSSTSQKNFAPVLACEVATVEYLHRTFYFCNCPRQFRILNLKMLSPRQPGVKEDANYFELQRRCTRRTTRYGCHLRVTWPTSWLNSRIKMRKLKRKEEL